MKAKIPILCAGILLFVATAAQATLDMNFYGDAVIQEGDSYSNVKIYDTPPGHTTVNMTGGVVDSLGSYDQSTLNVSGGNIFNATMRDSSTINISGLAEMYSVSGYGQATINISGGNILGAETRDSTTTMTISSNGSFTGVLAGGVLTISGNPTVDTVFVARTLTISGDPTIENLSLGFLGNIQNGTIGVLHLGHTSIVNLFGGNTMNVVPSGPGRSEQPLPFAGEVNVYGYNLVKTDSGGIYGYGQVYGSYLDGTEFSVDLGEGIYPHVNLIPEPATILLLTLGVFFVKRNHN